MGQYDRDFAGDIDDRKSTAGFVFLLGNNVVLWSSNEQPIVTLSTFMCMSFDMAKEIIDGTPIATNGTH